MNEPYYKKNIKINLPEAVRFILKTLRNAGFEAYAVGGCVRDSILKKEPKDWDITTSARPFETKKLFKRTIDTGIQHGTVTVMIKGAGYEVTTYRVDGEYTDGRHPNEVTFTSSLIEDLKRRDFTINAMAYNEEYGVVDCFGGIYDLEHKIIKCVGDSLERFTEDALRMLRAVRFSGVLGFDIDAETLSAIERLAPSISKISRERIQVELDKLIMSPHPDRVAVLQSTGLLKYIFTPPVSAHTKALCEKLTSAPKDHFIRWALFITYIEAENILRSLKFDNATVKISSQLFKYRDAKLGTKEDDLRFCIVEVGKDIFGRYYIPYRYALSYGNDVETKLLDEVAAAYDNIISRGDCLSIGELMINGNDIRRLGVTDGKQIGEILNKLFKSVLCDHTRNNRAYLLTQAAEYMNSRS